MNQVESRLPLGMISSILIHSLLIISVLNLNSDEIKTETIEVSYYGEGGGTGLIEGETISMGAGAETESTEWQEAMAVGVPAPTEPTPEKSSEPIPTPIPTAESVAKTEAPPDPPAPTPAEEIVKVAPVEKVEHKQKTEKVEKLVEKIEKKVVATPKQKPVAPAKTKKAPVVVPTSEDLDADRTESMLSEAEEDFAREAALAKQELQQKREHERLAEERRAEQAVLESQKQFAEEENQPSETKLVKANVTRADTVEDSLANAREAIAAANLGSGQPQARGSETGGQGSSQNSMLATNGGGGEENGNGFVRSLSDLRPMPGNPKPAYSVQERLEGQEGTVVFHAYVDERGQLSNFKIIQTSGYKGLDRKTLGAIQKWRFYPGQAGWVELPFDWALKGAPQEISPLAKEKVGSLQESEEE